MTTNANPTLGKVEDLFKDLVWDNLVQVALTAFFAYATFLNIPVIRQAVTKIVTLFTDLLFKYMKLYVDLGAITLANDAHESAFVKEVLVLRKIAKSKGMLSKEYLEEKERAKDALAAFVKFNG